MASSSTAAAEAAWVEPTKLDKPSKDADLKQAWAFLRIGVEHIMTRLHMGMSYSYYILLYTAIYDFCTQNRPHTSAFGAGHRGGASLQGADLYRSLHAYLSDHCLKMREEGEKLSDLELLKFYAKQWDRYTTGAMYVNKMFNYLNKHWVKREKDEGRKEVYTVYTLALVAWKQNFFKHLSSANGMSRLTQALLKQIELQRNGEEVDSGLLKRVIDSYVSLGLDEADAQRFNLEVYKEHFQTHFINSTAAYYKAESADFVANNSVSDYMKKAEDRLQEEADRVNLYLNDATRKELKETCEKTLIAVHAQVMCEEFQPLLDADKNEDLTRMYSLLMRIPNGLEALRKQFEEHVKRSGRAGVEKIMPTPGAEEGAKAEQLDPKAYVEALLEVHSKYSDVVNGPFRAELGFNASLDRACREFCNVNPAAATSTRSPELLASYADQLLRKNNKDMDADALELALNQVMVIFNFITDKDVFQKFYTKKLSARLVNGSSASEDSESSMISKLTASCGFEYTAKLTRMFTDIALSKDLTSRFLEKERASGSVSDVDFTVMVLGTNFWPLTPHGTEFSVPRQIQATYDKFGKYYNDAHSGRKLTWLWQHSKNELKTSYLNQKYIFMTSSYQMAILVQYNDGDSHSYADLATATKMNESLLKPMLQHLVKTKVLLQDGDDYDLNLNFKSKKIRVPLNQPMKAEQKQESNEVLASVEEDRTYVYQATVVRIMKSRKTMKHQALIQEVTSNISTKFTPKIPEIKKAIDHVIEKEYLERAEGSKDTYNYLA